MAREIKFRSVHKHFTKEEVVIREWGVMSEDHFASPSYVHGYKTIAHLQFTGKTCFNNKDIYEGDILFYEEPTDEGDERFYLVVTWIKEWSMFASLHVEEYKKYITEGAKSLDEAMFWTYTIEESESYHYAGNIYQNPDLLK